MLTTLSLGVLASLAAEVITWLNSKLTNTVLKGKAAFLFSAFIALCGGVVQVFFISHAPFTWASLYTDFSQVWVVSQAFFLLVVKFFGLDVQN